MVEVIGHISYVLLAWIYIFRSYVIGGNVSV